MAETLTIPQALVLLLTEPDGRKGVDGTTFDAGIAGAVLADLALRGCVSLSNDRVAVVPADVSLPTDDQNVLAGTLGWIAGEPKPRSAKWWITKTKGARLTETVATSLLELGILGQERRKALGLFPTTRYPELDGRIEADIRQDLDDVLAGVIAPNPYLATLVALLDATGALKKQYGRVPKEIVRGITEGSWASASVKQVLADIQSTVIMGAVIATTIAASAAAGS